ncbi:MAG: hypothetical protein DLM58_20695 [Pseudonocardiales bacterium]|nr:MAG: hypothetical protein DLM58_20695 [Pseudonocardiales bacterium]
MRDNIDIEAALRDSLSEHARHAPAAGLLAERIINQAELAPPARKRQWRTWTLPLIAAGTVATVAAAMFGITQIRHSADHKPPAIPATSPVPAPTPTGSAPTTPSPGGRSSTAKQTNPAVPPPLPAKFTALDLTFVSADEGWALGTADCLTGRGRCTALAHTSDGGATWTGAPPPPANVATSGCAAQPCVAHIRFADPQIGYAWGTRLFMTTDAGRTWTAGKGVDAQNVNAVEVANGVAVRVLVTGAIQVAPVGTDTWRATALLGGGATIDFVRSGHNAYYAGYRNPAGGGQSAHGALWYSHDDGSTWTARGEVCPQQAYEVDSAAMAVAGDGSLVVLCTPRFQKNVATSLLVSRDGGLTFQSGTGPASGLPAVIGAASSSVLFVVADALYRSGDSGRSWQRIYSVHLQGNAEPWLGFESATVGRLVSGDGSTIWTTRDAGLTWTAHTFH